MVAPRAHPEVAARDRRPRRPAAGPGGRRPGRGGHPSREHPARPHHRGLRHAPLGHRGGQAQPVRGQGPGQRAAARRRLGHGRARPPHRHGRGRQHRHPHRRHHAVQPAAQPGEPALPGRQPARSGLPERVHRVQGGRGPAQRRLRQRPGAAPRAASAPPTTRAPTGSSSASARRSACTSTTTRWSTWRASRKLVDALGGITVNINYWVPINGIPDSNVLPDDYFTPGPNQHLDG